MNHPDYDLMIQTERRKDEMAAADHYRLLKSLEPSPGRRRMSLVPQNPLRPLVVQLARGMAWLGSQLTSWSCRLQQYTSAPMLGAAPEEQPCSG